MAKMNPSFKKSTTTTLKVSGIYDRNGEIILDDDEGVMDTLSLFSTFHNMQVTITVKATEDEENE